MQNHSDQLKLAVVGVGALGRHHARILSQMPGVDLVAVSDANQEQGQSVAASCGCDWTPDFRTLLDKVDAVSIVVPTFLHRPIAEVFLCRNIPVMVEKPLTANVEDGSVLVRLAREHDVPLQVGHIERFNPAFESLAERVGSPKYIRGERVSPYAFRSMDVGAVLDLMIHDIELTLALVGEMPTQVEAFGATLVGGNEDCVQARLHFPGGCIADLTANRVAPSFTRTMQCWSDRGSFTADFTARTVTAMTPGEAILNGELPFELVMQGKNTPAELKPEIFTRFINQSVTTGSEVDALTAELASFVNCVRTGRAPLVSGAQGLNALRVAEQILQSVGGHQWDGSPTGRCGPNALLEHYLGGGLTKLSEKAA
ncbi:Gfo/Idh/MocA family oxidoreductase [Planctomicrobium sp. SH668]|uniref:Gfo/Idh/MocA family oxidoreductase n=1 Tax=Planctomicrobium sp. SH668 TaxID=3448126 RepID=UPI003F5B3482